MTDVFEGVGTAGVRLDHYAYDLLSERTGQSYATPVGGAATFNTSYGYTASGDVQQITHSLSGGVSVGFTYGYNVDHQRKSLQVTDSSYLPTALTPVSVSYTSNALNQYTKLNTVNLTNDAAGNLSYDGTFGYCYDALNRLVQVGNTVTGPTTPCATGSATLLSTYSYDALNRQSAKIVNGVTTKYVYAGTDMIGEYSSTDAVQHRYVFGPGVNEPLASIDSTGVRGYHLPDSLGSTIALASGSGAVTEKHAYTAYGASQTSGGTPYQYTGQRLDAETGLYYEKARYYSSTLGRFLQPDPIGTADGLNIFAYVRNDPLNRTDPTGLFEQMGRDVYSLFPSSFTYDGFWESAGNISDLLAGISPAFSEVSVGFRASEEAAGALEQAIVHGNSRLSTRTAYLYELYSLEDGSYLKTGISQNPSTRYSNAFMSDKLMSIITSGTRSDMLMLERQRIIANPGPLNREPWAR